MNHPPTGYFKILDKIMKSRAKAKKIYFATRATGQIQDGYFGFVLSHFPHLFKKSKTTFRLPRS